MNVVVTKNRSNGLLIISLLTRTVHTSQSELLRERKGNNSVEWNNGEEVVTLTSLKVMQLSRIACDP